MKIGIALPSNVPGSDPRSMVEFAKRAEAASFATVAANDRLAYVTMDPLASLSAVAAVTDRVRLMTSILVAPIHNAGLLATQTATIDALSGGRLTLGMAVGGREDDYLAGLSPFRGRGKRFDEMLAHMKRVWAGETFADDSHPAGPAPVQSGGPEIILGGSAPAAIDRVGRFADGFVAGGGGNLERARQVLDQVQESWDRHEREGAPRFLSGLSFALGDESRLDQARANQRDYYAWLGPEIAEARGKGIATSADAIKATLERLESIGVDEVILQPTLPELDQLDRVAEVVF